MAIETKIETAANVGIDNKNEILAESTLLKSKNRADVITIPDSIYTWDQG